STRLRVFRDSLLTVGFIRLAPPESASAAACAECYGHVRGEFSCQCGSRYERFEPFEGARTGRRRDQYDRQRARGEAAVAGDYDGSDTRGGLPVSGVVLQLALELRKG